MLFMLTPEIKTNLILKEIGVKRYSYRTNQPKSKEKNLNYLPILKKRRSEMEEVLGTSSELLAAFDEALEVFNDDG